MLRDGNQLAECEVQARESWQGRQKLYGTASQAASDALWLLADTSFERGDLAATDALLMDAPLDAVSPGWLGRTVAGEEERFWLIRTLTGLAWQQQEASKPASAQRYGRYAANLARPLLLKRQSNPPPEAWRIANARSLLGGALVAAALTDVEARTDARVVRLAEAEPLLLEGYRGLQESAIIPAVRRSSFLRDAAERLVRLHELWDALAPDTGHAAQAHEWRDRLPK